MFLKNRSIKISVSKSLKIKESFKTKKSSHKKEKKNEENRWLHILHLLRGREEEDKRS